MKKILIGASLLLLVILATYMVIHNQQEPKWVHKYDLDEMTDQEGHGISTGGLTKYGESFYFSFVCLGPSNLLLLHDNGTDLYPPSTRAKLKTEGTNIRYRVGAEKALGSVWILSPNQRTEKSSIGTIAKNTVETRDPKVVLAIMNGLEQGETILIEYNDDVSKIEGDKFFTDTYARAKSGCGF